MVSLRRTMSNWFVKLLLFSAILSSRTSPVVVAGFRMTINVEGRPGAIPNKKIRKLRGIKVLTFIRLERNMEK